MGDESDEQGVAGEIDAAGTGVGSLLMPSVQLVPPDLSDSVIALKSSQSSNPYSLDPKLTLMLHLRRCVVRARRARQGYVWKHR